MRHFITAGVLSFILGCGESQTVTEKTDSPQQENKTSSDYSVYVNKDKGFTISYPAKWDTTVKDSNMAFIAVERDPDTTDRFNESLSVSVFPDKGLTLQQTVDKNIEFAKKYYGTPEISKQKTSTGLDCIILQIKQDVQGISLISYSVFFDNGSNVYTLTHTMDASKKDKYNPIINTVINSFNWVKN